MEYGIFSFNEFIYSDTSPKNGKKFIELIAPKNSYIYTQVLIKNTDKADFHWEGDYKAPDNKL